MMEPIEFARFQPLTANAYEQKNCFGNYFAIDNDAIQNSDVNIRLGNSRPTSIALKQNWLSKLTERVIGRKRASGRTRIVING